MHRLLLPFNTFVLNLVLLFLTLPHLPNIKQTCVFARSDDLGSDQLALNVELNSKSVEVEVFTGRQCSKLS